MVTPRTQGARRSLRRATLALGCTLILTGGVVAAPPAHAEDREITAADQAYYSYYHLDTARAKVTRAQASPLRSSTGPSTPLSRSLREQTLRIGPPVAFTRAQRMRHTGLRLPLCSSLTPMELFLMQLFWLIKATRQHPQSVPIASPLPRCRSAICRHSSIMRSTMGHPLSTCLLQAANMTTL